jgi:phasin
MDTNSKPEAAPQRARQQYSEGQEALLQTAFPQAAREFAEKTVAQTREAYERSNKVLETTLETIEKSFDAAGQGAVALNRKIMEIAQRNLNSGFELAKQLAGAKNLAEIVELQSAYWQKQVEALTSQAEEVRSLATKVAADAAQPTKEHVKRSMDDVSKKS